MASKIIKQGSDRAFDIRQYSFAEGFSISLPTSDKTLCSSISGSPESNFEGTAVVAKDAPLVDMETLRREAYDKGFMDGEAAAKNAAAKQIESAKNRYANAIDEFRGIKRTLHTQAEHEVVKLAIEIAKKIVHREIQADRNIIQTLVRVALSHITEKKSVTVRLNPADYQYVLDRRGELASGDDWDLSLQSDNSVGQGGCLIETPCGDIDARIEEKFKEVENAFFEDFK